jgi:hypothetical protein
MSSPLPDPNKWKLVVNTNYQDLIKTLMSLTTASLVVPFLLIKNFLAVPEGKSLADYLPRAAYWFWALMFVSLVCDAVFFWASAKFVKVVIGGTEARPEQFFESLRDVAIWGAGVFFAAGLVSFAVLGWKILHRLDQSIPNQSPH